jgi:hypothetical protein
MKQINSNNNNSNAPKGTKDKVYSAVVYPNNKCCLMMAHVAESCSNDIKCT